MESVDDDTASSSSSPSDQSSVWGAAAFSRALRSRLWARTLVEEAREEFPTVDWSQLPNPAAYNVLVLGPAGAGKSSLLYTWWRSLHDSPTEEEQQGVLEQLNLGWGMVDAKRLATGADGAGSEGRRLRSRHGTNGLRIFEMLSSRGSDGAGLCIHDTKGQQFFDGAERHHTGNLLKGVALEGSNQEKENLRYWFSIGRMGFFEQRSLRTSPHVVVLVFDIMLRSLQKMISSVDSSKGLSPQLELYCNVIQQAKREGLEVFIALTHLDLYEEKQAASATAATPTTIGTADAAAADAASPPSLAAVHVEETRVGEACAEGLGDLSSNLSRALRLGGAEVASNRIFVVENYRATKNGTDPRVELAALELLESLADSADGQLLRKCQARKEGCSVM